MKPAARVALRGVVNRFGPNVIDDPRGLEAILRDLLPGMRPEVSVLVEATRARVPHEIRDRDPTTPPDVLRGRLAKLLLSSTAVKEDAAQWAIDAWAEAFGATIAPPPPPPPPALPPLPPPKPGTRTLVVSERGDGDCRTLEEAVRRGGQNAVIRVRPGHYPERLVIGSPVTIVGDGPTDQVVVLALEGAALTIDSADVRVRGLTFHKRGKSTDEAPAVLVRAGPATLEDLDVSSNGRVGLAITASAKLYGCRIRECAGVGVLVATDAAVTLDRCEVARAGGTGILVDGANVKITRSRVLNGAADGVHVTKGSALLEDCDVALHGGHGVVVASGASPTIRECAVHDGRKDGIRFMTGATGLVERTVVESNAKVGVGFERGSQGTVRQCRIRGNGETGLLVGEQSSPVVPGGEIIENAKWGVEIASEAHPLLRDVVIQRNALAGIRVRMGGKGVVENCDLRENGKPWDFWFGCRTERRNNNE